MNALKADEALALVEQMIDRGDAPLGLVQVRDLLREALAPDADGETVYIGAEPPCEDHDIDGRLRSVFIRPKHDRRTR